MSPNTNLLDPGKTSEIQVLTKKTDDLSRAVDGWNSGYMWAGGFALLVAIWVSLSQSIIILKSRQLSAAQADLIAAKDRVAKDDSLVKDQKIADALKSAADSNQAAGEAKERAANATERAVEATKVAEAEKIERLKLEAQIQPRQYTAEEQEAIVKACAGFAGHSVVIRSLPYDVEGAVFATSLAELLTSRTALKINASGIGDNFMQNLPMVIDVHVIGPPAEQPLINALTEALATPRVTVAPSSPSPHLTIIVGGKRLAPPSITQ